MTTDPWGKPAPSDPWAKPVDTQSPPAPDAWGLPPSTGWGPMVPPIPAPAKDPWGVPDPFGADAWGNTLNDVLQETSEAEAESERQFEASGWGHAAGFKAPEVDPVFPIYMYDGEGDDYLNVEDAENLELCRLNGGCEEITFAEYEAGLARKRQERDAERDVKWVHDGLAGADERANIANSFQQTHGMEWAVSQDGELERMPEVIATTSKSEPTGFYLAYHSGKVLHAILSGPYASTQAAYMQADEAWQLFINDVAFKLAFDNKFERSGVYIAEIPLKAKRHGAYGVLPK